MYHSYLDVEHPWEEGLRRMQDFCRGTLPAFLASCRRRGRLGVRPDLDRADLLRRLPGLVRRAGRFGLWYDTEGTVRLLVVPVHEQGRMRVRCFGAWPGLDAWETEVERHLPCGVNLLDMRWNDWPAAVEEAEGQGLQGRFAGFWSTLRRAVRAGGHRHA